MEVDMDTQWHTDHGTYVGSYPTPEVSKDVDNFCIIPWNFVFDYQVAWRKVIEQQSLSHLIE